MALVALLLLACTSSGTLHRKTVQYRHRNSNLPQSIRCTCCHTTTSSTASSLECMLLLFPASLKEWTFLA